MNNIIGINEYDYLIKLIVGDSAVGKSSILTMFCDNFFSETYISTIGIDFKTKIICLDDRHIKFPILGYCRSRKIQSNDNNIL